MKSTNEIEPKIKPLVDVLNKTGILSTFSSCQGHFSPQEQEYQDRNHADVRFDPLESVSEYAIESFLSFLLTKFNSRHSCNPVSLEAHKLFTPTLGEEKLRIFSIYVIEIKVFDRFSSWEEKRNNVDKAILQTTKIVEEWNRKKEKPTGKI